MRAYGHRHIKSGKEYDRYFPAALGTLDVISQSADTDDTLKLMGQKVKEHRTNARAIAEKLKASTLKDTLKNIWQFTYDHIQYKLDSKFAEEVRSFARTWKDRKGDCDCASVFQGTILAALGIPFAFRVSNNGHGAWGHVYVIVPDKNHSKGYWTLDFCMENFDEEADYDEIKTPEYYMDLHSLNGTTTMQTGNIFKKIGKGFKKVLRSVSTVAMFGPRNSLLLGMKVNLFNVARRIRYGYLTESQANALGINPVEHSKLVKVREKLENTFHQFGGKKENLKKAILKGKGNKDKKVALSGIYGKIDELAELTMLPMGDANMLPMGGEPVTTATVLASAAAVLAPLAKILDSINLGAQKQAAMPDSDTPYDVDDVDAEDVDKAIEEESDLFKENAVVTQPAPHFKKITEDALPSSFTPTTTPTTTTTTTTSSDSGKPKKEGEGIVGWVKENPLASIAIGAVAATIVYKIATAKPSRGMSGVRKKRKKIVH